MKTFERVHIIQWNLDNSNRSGTKKKSELSKIRVIDKIVCTYLIRQHKCSGQDISSSYRKFDLQTFELSRFHCVYSWYGYFVRRRKHFGTNKIFCLVETNKSFDSILPPRNPVRVRRRPPRKRRGCVRTRDTTSVEKPFGKKTKTENNRLPK